MTEPTPRSTSPQPPAAGPGDTQPRSWFVRGSDNLDLLKALFLGVAVTAIFYEVFPLPFIDEQRVVVIFDSWVAEVILGMTLWSFFILLFKFRNHSRQSAARQAFLQPSVMAVFDGGVTAAGVNGVVQRLRDALMELKVRQFADSVIYRRVYRVLAYIRSVPKREGLNELLDYQAQIDVKKLDSSYTVLQVFIWAIPILGFIGTVLGIADSVREFSSFIQTAESGAQFSSQMRGALGGVTNGLAVAFNTTFLALVLVIPVMLVTSILQKNEEELLLAVEEYCLEDLLPHFAMTAAADPVTESFDEHLLRIQQLSTNWLGQFEPLLKSLSLQVDMVRHQLGGVQPLVKDFTDRLMASPQQTDVGSSGSGGEPSPGVGQIRTPTAPARKKAPAKKTAAARAAKPKKAGEAAPAKSARPKPAAQRRAPAKKRGEDAP